MSRLAGDIRISRRAYTYRRRFWCPSVRWTTTATTTAAAALAAILLGTNNTIHAFTHRDLSGYHYFLQRRSLNSLSSINENGIEADLDVTKLQRLYVGDPNLTYRVLAPELSSALQPKPISSSSSSSSSTLLQPEIPITLTQDQSNYLLNVLRLGKKTKADPYVRLFDGNGQEWLAKVLAPANNAKGRRNNEPLHVICTRMLRTQPKDNGDIDKASHHQQQQRCCWLAVALPKNKDRIRWTIEKCTELGVSGFILLNSEFSQTPTIPVTKMMAYAIEAAEQSERLTVPRFVMLSQDSAGNDNYSYDDAAESTTTVHDFMKAWKLDDPKASCCLGICRERLTGALPLFDFVSRCANNQTKDVVFVVGPEGGWSPSETQSFDDLTNLHPDTVHAVSIGSTVLRSETACMLAVGAFSLANEL